MFEPDRALRVQINPEDGIAQLEDDSLGVALAYHPKQF
jgi:hypothetical protein